MRSFLKRLKYVLGASVFMLQAHATENPNMANIAVINPDSNIDVTKFKNSDVALEDIVIFLEEGLRNSGHFIVFDRNEFSKEAVLAEQAFAQTGQFAGNAAEFGKLRNVDLIVRPLIMQFASNVNVKSDDEVPGKFVKRDTAHLVVNYRVLDTTTMQIKFSTIQEADFDSGRVRSDTKTSTFARESWIGLVKAISKKAVSSIGDRIFPMLVMKYQNNQVFINRGEGAGIDVNDIREIFSVGEDLIDPNTGKSLGSTEESIGKIKVMKVNPKFSIAVPVDKFSMDPKPGDTVR